MSRKPVDLTGRTFGCLRPVRLMGEVGYRFWECLCDAKLGGCGRTVRRTLSHLYRVESCGCLQNSRSYKADRNAELFDRWQEGESCDDLADDFLVSKQRVQQIVQGEAERRGVKLRDRLRGGGPEPLPISADLIEWVKEGKVSVAEAARREGVCTATIAKRAGKVGEARYQLAREKNAEVYRKFMDGATLKELAEEYGTTKGAISQFIIRHRRRTGEPAKCPHLKPKCFT